MADKPKPQREKRSRERVDEGPELAELRSLVAAQTRELEQLRREVGWLSEELIASDQADAESGAASEPESDPRRMPARVRRLVHEHVPHGSSLAVLSSGDESLLRYVGCKAEHLSQDREGRYTDHPSCARAAIVQLEAARWRGADVLVIPQNGLWWLEHYGEFAKHLERHYMPVVREADLGAVWNLRATSPLRAIDDKLAGLPVQPGHQPVVLDWHTGQDLATTFPDYKVFSPIENLPLLPYLDHTVEVVAIQDKVKRKTWIEARRVASDLLISVRAGSPPAMDALWCSPRLTAGQDDVSVVAVSRGRRPLSLQYVGQLLDSLPAAFGGEIVLGIDRDTLVPQLGPEAARLKRLKVIPFREDEGFASRARHGVGAAKEEIVVVLDGSTWPVTGWLPPLVRLIREGTRVGVAAGSFVLPDGRRLDRTPPSGRDASASAAQRDEANLDNADRRHVCPTTFEQDSLFATWRELLLESDPGVTAFSQALSSRALAAGLMTVSQPETLAIAPWRMRQSGVDLEPVDA